MMIDKNLLVSSINYARLCQRNFDDTPVKPDDVELFKTLIELAPRKQGVVWHKTLFIENRELIHDMYMSSRDHGYHSPHNAQMSAPLLVIALPYSEYKSQHYEETVATNFNNENREKTSYRFISEDMHTSVGIHMGMLALAANQLGYRTGFCTCFDDNFRSILYRLLKEEYDKELIDDRVVTALGIGYPIETIPHNYDVKINTAMYRHKSMWVDNDLVHIK